jgi:uncharacterized protein
MKLSIKRLRVFASTMAMLAAVAGQATVDEDTPVHGTIAGGGAGGTGTIVGETAAQIIRAAYPGSAINYEPGTVAGSFIALLGGRVPLAITGTGEIEGAMHAEPPFTKRSSPENFAIVANLLSGDAMVGVIYVRRAFVEKYALRDLSDIKTRQVPVRLSTNQTGNVTTVRHADAVLAAYGITRADIEHWGGRDYHVPDTAGLQMMQDGKLDLIITLGFHPDHRVLEASRATALMLLPIAPSIAAEVARRINTDVGRIPAGTYDFLTSDYTSATMGSLYLTAGPAADDDMAYKVAKALYYGIEQLRAAHPTLANMTRERLADAGRYRLHPGAARFYREVNLLPAENIPQNSPSAGAWPARYMRTSDQILGRRILQKPVRR